MNRGWITVELTVYNFLTYILHALLKLLKVGVESEKNAVTQMKTAKLVLYNFYVTFGAAKGKLHILHARYGIFKNEFLSFVISFLHPQNKRFSSMECII